VKKNTIKLFCNGFLLIGALLSFNVVVAQKPVVKKTVPQKAPVQKIVPVVKTVVPVTLPVKTFSNGINLTAKGFVVQDAYLVFNDRTKVPDDNMIDLKKQVNLTLIISSGFKPFNGKVFPGGSEKITLSTGEKILESGDVFKAYDSVGVNAMDAKYIILKAIVTEINFRKYDVDISFKVWDKKNADNEINGSYKLYIK
jgi:hypothetical protein